MLCFKSEAARKRWERSQAHKREMSKNNVVDKNQSLRNLFNQGTFLFNNPTCSSNQGDRQISISGSDKWSLLNGAHGGIIEGTYIVYAGSTFGDMIRRTLNLDIVADPIPPNIHPRLENAEVTYDITKTSGNTIADIILDVALNIGAYVYYDVNGRFTAIPMDEDIYKPNSYIFEEGNVTYFSSSRTIGLEDVYNSVLVISENVTETQDVIMKELQNNDTTDPNSIGDVCPECGAQLNHTGGCVECIECGWTKCN